jgi:uncharacterized protein (DUF3820 family)
MPTQNIQCKKCGSTKYHTEPSGPHTKAICDECGSYIQFLQQGFTGETIMFYGKYKGRRLDSIPPDYLVWLYENTKVSGSLKTYIESNLNSYKQKIFEAK